MREHLYKAKRVNWRELPKEEWWVEGYLLLSDKDCYIIPDFGVSCVEKLNNYVCDRFITLHAFEVDKETVCEYTGLADKNGRKIFENDIIGRYSEYREERYCGVVKYGEFNCSCCSGVYGWYFDDEDIRDCDLYEVRGNIFDNLELLEGGEAE